MRNRFPLSSLAIKMLVCLAMLSVPRIALCREGQGVYLGRMLLGWDIGDLPENPTLEEQIEAGRKQLAAERETDEALDSNREVFEHFNDLAARLVAGSEQKPAFPISVHVSSTPVQNAFALPGGQIMLYEKMFDTTDNEAQLVSVMRMRYDTSCTTTSWFFGATTNTTLISMAPAACSSNR
jgi:predicted Zn-dependent protease